MPSSVVEAPPEVGVTEVARQVGVPYWHVERWVTAGYLSTLDEDPNPGSGRARRLPVSELAVARWIAALTAVGFRLSVAARYARDAQGRRRLGQMLLRDEVQP